MTSSHGIARGRWAAFAAVMLGVLLTPSSSLAADINLAPGGTAVIAESDKEITGAQAKNGGTVKVDVLADPKRWKLTYTAKQTTTPYDDIVTWTAGGASNSANVKVALKDPPSETAEKPKEPPTLTSPGVYEPSFKALFVVFLLAVLLESGLAIVFNWRPFVTYFDGRAVKPVVSFLISFVLVEYYDFDVVTSLVNLYQQQHFLKNHAGSVLTAMIIAGGSSGVNDLFVRLGFRAPRPQTLPIAKPPATKAWIAVSLNQKEADGMVDVLVTPAGAAAGRSMVVGSIDSSGGKKHWWTRDRARFPSAGGHELVPGEYHVQLKGHDKNGVVKESAVWGPYEIAPGAVIDIELTV